jgi:hypothetical protein
VQARRNPWKRLALLGAVAASVLLVAGAMSGVFQTADRASDSASIVVVDSAPPVSIVDECNRTAELVDPEDAADSTLDTASHAARRPGTIVGMSEQNSRSAAARAAFRDCMLRKGYAS